MPWTPPSNEEILVEDDLKDARQKASRYLAVLSGEEEEAGTGGDVGGNVTTLIFTLADFTSSLSQGIHPKATSKTWPQLLGVSRELRQLLDRNPPPPQGVDEAQHGRLKTTLGNFLARVQKMEDQAKVKEALLKKEEEKEEEEEETSLPEVPEQEEEEPEEDEEAGAQEKEGEKPEEEEVTTKHQEEKEDLQEEKEEPLQEGKEEEAEGAQGQEERPPEEEREEIPEDEDTPPKLVPVAPEREEALTRERPAGEAKKEEKAEGRPAEPEMGAGDILTVAGILVAVVSAYMLYRWMY